MRVMIYGRPGDGKTTLAIAFQEFLKERGFADVTVHDADAPHIERGLNQSRRMSSIADREVRIETGNEPIR